MQLSFADGAQVACGFGTVYEGLEKIGIDGNHAVLITGLGPVGLATGALCRKLGANKIIGIDVVPERMKIALDLGLCDAVLASGPDNVAQVRELTGGMGVERAVDCSANHAARATAIRATRKWGKIVFLGEGGTVEFNPSPDIIHDQKTIYGSWVTSTWLMEELVERLVRWNLHPADIITHRFPLDKAADAYALMASGKCGKVAVCQDEELKEDSERGKQTMTASITSAAPDWKTRLSDLLPLFGHRNWIVVADAAYPAQSKPGIETIVSGCDQLDVVRHVLDAITACSHVRANIYADFEAGFVEEADAPGIAEYRTQLWNMLDSFESRSVYHDQIIHKLDQSAQLFRVLVIKTDMTIPYTSVFFELDCGYWIAEAEERLRYAITTSDSIFRPGQFDMEETGRPRTSPSE